MLTSLGRPDSLLNCNGLVWGLARAYDWGVNSIHGIQVSCGTQCATNYPLPVAIGASFNRTLVKALGQMMAVELRALRLEVRAPTTAPMSLYRPIASL